MKLNTSESLNIYLAKEDQDLLEGQEYDENKLLFDLKWKTEDRQFITLGREGKSRMNTKRHRQDTFIPAQCKPRGAQMKQFCNSKP
jgi:hypothetical protein